MTAPNSRRDFVVALLIAVWAHVGLFFVFVMLMVFDLLSAGVIEGEKPEDEKDPPVRMQMVYEEAPAAVVAEEEVLSEQVPEPAPVTEPVAVMPDAPAFVETHESQTADKAPEETPLIGERNTTATSDAGAVAGDEKMAALAGTEDRKSAPKTFDSNFSEGEKSRQQEGMEETVEAGQGEEQKGEQAAMVDAPQPEPVDDLLAEIEEELPKPKDDELASIEDTLAALEEAISDSQREPVERPSEKVEETMPEKPAVKEQEASNQDGGFAPKAKKTRVAGVLSASGEGSLNVADTPAGRYQAAIMKKLETAWRMDNINNRSLNAPGQITLYFVVDEKGQISHQRPISRVGASDNQWGRLLGVVGKIAIPKMPKDVIKDLDDEALEIIVTFNY